MRVIELWGPVVSMAENVMLESARVRPLACPGIGCAKRLVLAKIVTKRIKRCMKGATTAELVDSEWWVYYNGSKGQGGECRESGSAIIVVVSLGLMTPGGGSSCGKRTGRDEMGNWRLWTSTAPQFRP